MKHSIIVFVSVLLVFSGCQFFGPQQSGKENSLKNDSLIVREMHFNDDPQAPIEWKVAMKKTKEGTYVRHGESIRYTKSGGLAEKINYVDNKKEGLRLAYHSTGKVWKEQPYKNGRLEGNCKRYDREGRLTAEYPYKNGLPGIGLVEYTNLGKKRNQPEIQIERVDNIRTSGSYILVCSLEGKGKEHIKKVEFFEGKLIEGKFFHKNLTALKITSSIKGELIIEVPKGYVVDKQLNIIAKAITTSDLIMIQQKPVKIAVRRAR